MKEDRQRLSSWKAIARHLGCSVRTARRWEQHEGLPVHRQMHRVQASVYAYADELDAWRNRFETSPGATRIGGVTASEPAGASLAVMPFAFVGSDTASNFVADGLTDELIARLSRIPTLKVICRTSSMALKDTELPARDIARQLAVNHLLEGTVRVAGERLRVTVRLVDPRQDLTTWSDQFDGELGDVFDLQESIARCVAGALELRLTRQEDRLLSRSPADGAEVWQYLQRSRQAALRWRPDSIGDAVGLLEQGIRRYGERPSLLAALGRTHLQYREAGLDLGDAPVQAARDCVGRLERLGEAGAAARLLAGWVAYAEGRIADAVNHLEAALREDRNEPDALGLLANCLLISGRSSAARPFIDRLVSIDPLTPLSVCMPGWAAVLEGNTTGALEPYRAMHEMDPGNPFGRLFYVWVLILNERIDDARAITSGFPASQRDHPATAVAGMFVAAAAGGPTPTPSADVEEAARATEMFSRLLAEVYVQAGDAPNAARWFGVAMSHGFINAPYLAEHHPAMRMLKSEPPMAALLEDMRARWRSFPVPADQAPASSSKIRPAR